MIIESQLFLCRKYLATKHVMSSRCRHKSIERHNTSRCDYGGTTSDNHTEIQVQSFVRQRRQTTVTVFMIVAGREFNIIVAVGNTENLLLRSFGHVVKLQNLPYAIFSE